MRAIVLWLHLLAATVWIGGMAFLAFAIVPYARGLSERERSALVQGVGRNFRVAGWVAVIVLVLTGLLNLEYASLSVSALFAPSLTRSPYGRTLAWKLLLFVMMVVVALYHDFGVSGEFSRRTQALETMNQEERAKAMPEVDALRRRAGMLGRVTFLLALAILYLGVRLVRP